jgi:hypothetical protein
MIKWSVIGLFASAALAVVDLTYQNYVVEISAAPTSYQVLWYLYYFTFGGLAIVALINIVCELCKRCARRWRKANRRY